MKRGEERAPELAGSVGEEVRLRAKQMAEDEMCRIKTRLQGEESSRQLQTERAQDGNLERKLELLEFGLLTE